MGLRRIAVFGATGQIGSALVELLAERAIPLSRHEAELLQPESLSGLLDALAPDAVINAAAHTAVDAAEQEREAAFAINAASPAAMAQWCARHDVPFVHYSTDYVFNGTGQTPWHEEDTPDPLNVYGASKLAGERGIVEAGGEYLIFRTSWVYDAAGKNFFNTMLRLAAERETLSVVADQTGAPCYAPDLARYSLKALENAVKQAAFPSGIYHMAHGGQTSWYGFATAIFAGAQKHGVELRVKTVEPLTTSAYPTPAKRPMNSRLDCSKLQSVLGVSLPSWEQGLALALEKKYHAGHHLPA